MKLDDICVDDKGSEYSIIKIDKTDVATWITLKGTNDKTTACGYKVFKAKYTIKKPKKE